MIQLRPYQLEAIDQLRGHFAKNRRKIVLCLPTGAGKTVVFSSLVKATLEKNPLARVLILTHRQELLTQAGGTLNSFGIQVEAITAKRKHINPDARCYVGMVETYYRRLKQNPHLLNMTLIIIDEAHYGNFKKLFSEFSTGQFIVGATATPISAAKTDPLSNYYDDIICPVQIPDLIEQGYLSKVLTYAAPINRSALKKDWSGEFSEASLMQIFDKREVYANLLTKFRQFGIRENGEPTKTIIFNVNIAHSKEVTRQFNEAGISARHVDGETPDAERAVIIRDFRNGIYPVICNVGILNAGFDDSAVETVIVNRATTSLPLWLQMAGRGSRIHPGKTHFTLIDMGDNHKDLFLWQALRDWDHLFRAKKKESDREGIAPVKDCPECGAILPIQQKICDACGYEFPAKEEDKKPDADFVLIDGVATKVPVLSDSLRGMDKPSKWPALTVQELHEIQCIKGRKIGWVVNVIRDRCLSQQQFYIELSQFGRLKGYKPGWAEHQSFSTPGASQWQSSPQYATI